MQKTRAATGERIAALMRWSARITVDILQLTKKRPFSLRDKTLRFHNVSTSSAEKTLQRLFIRREQTKGIIFFELTLVSFISIVPSTITVVQRESES